jgi:hypothetical protein
MQKNQKEFTKLRTSYGTDFMRVTIVHCGEDYVKFVGTISTGTIAKEFICPYHALEFLMD